MRQPVLGLVGERLEHLVLADPELVLGERVLERADHACVAVKHLVPGLDEVGLGGRSHAVNSLDGAGNFC